MTDPVAKELLASRIPARLAYIGPDGGPRVVPIGFWWNGDAFVPATATWDEWEVGVRKPPGRGAGRRLECGHVD